MQFSRFTDDEYYLIWDSDTVPVRQINFFDGQGRMFLDHRSMMVEGYFRTLQKLLPEADIPAGLSFVTEHMLIKTQYMRELLSGIEENSSLPGKSFQEKIINAVDVKDLPACGFSEYETYGNFLALRHPEDCTLRKWSSLRLPLSLYSSGGIPGQDEISWFAQKYYALSFESWQKKSFLASVILSNAFRRSFSLDFMERLLDAEFALRSPKHLIGRMLPSALKEKLKTIAGCYRITL